MAIDSRRNTFAHVLERAGLGAAGASCGLFVAAHLARAGVQELSSVEFIFGMMLLGAVGFYLGIDLPPRDSPLRTAQEQTPGSISTFDLVETLSALGTFIAPMTALLSVYYIIADVNARHLWSVVIGIGWLCGGMMQVIAGTIARLRRRTFEQPEVVKKCGSGGALQP